LPCIHGFGAMISMVAGYFSWCSFFDLSCHYFGEMFSKLAMSITNVDDRSNYGYSNLQAILD
jgi:hypothetical protein